MRFSFLSFILTLPFFFAQAQTPLSLEQRIALIEKSVQNRIPDILQSIANENVQLTLVIYKKEQTLELWQTQPTKKKLKSYPFTQFSGYLGPKNRQGDRQIPEGLYKIELLNPNSRYYLSARINYPNDLDKKRGQQYKITDMGGDIYIHGKNKTIGCVPIGDKNMEELFYTLHKVGLSKVSVIMSPSHLPLPELKQMGLLEHDIHATKKYELIKQALTQLTEPPTTSTAN